MMAKYPIGLLNLNLGPFTAILELNMQRGPSVGSLINEKSGYRGVSWCKITKRWRATGKFNGKWTFIGYFLDAELAAFAYNAMAYEKLGPKAELNQIYRRLN